MASLYTLAGAWTVDPAEFGVQSFDPTFTAPVQESVLLARKLEVEYTLTADAPVTLPVGGPNDAIKAAHVLQVRAVGGKVRLRITTIDGAVQSVPADPLLIVISTSTPITAVDVTRTPATLTTVKVLLGDMGP
jgi:hypothetical protein